MKRLLLVHHTLHPPGGGSAVGAWAIQALRDKFDITVLTWTPADVARINRAFGTDLRDDGVHWVTASESVRKVIEAIPMPLALFTMHLLIRRAKAMQREQRFDVVVGTMNEIDVGERAIQYIHYPWAKFPRPNSDYRWYHFNLPLLAYRWLCTTISGYRNDLVNHNVTLANSDWTGDVYERLYGTRTRTLYPPVPGGFPEIPFDARENGFVCLGRISAEKELEKLIKILAGVRARGHDIQFHIIGHHDNSAYGRHLTRIAEAHGKWITFHHDLPRDELVSLIARNRYGIHGMVGEHFGIAPAELQRGGCITFVPDDGGPVEIVDHDERVIYRSADDAVEKIDRVLGDPDLRASILADIPERARQFSEQRFMTELLEVADTFER